MNFTIGARLRMMRSRRRASPLARYWRQRASSSSEDALRGAAWVLIGAAVPPAWRRDTVGWSHARGCTGFRPMADGIARSPGHLPRGWRGSARRLGPRNGQLLTALGVGRKASGSYAYGHRAGPDRPRRLGHAARRLLARRPRRGDP